jgi:hypothetical protein
MFAPKKAKGKAPPFGKKPTSFKKGAPAEGSPEEEAMDKKQKMPMFRRGGPVGRAFAIGGSVPSQIAGSTSAGMASSGTTSAGGSTGTPTPSSSGPTSTPQRGFVPPAKGIAVQPGGPGKAFKGGGMVRRGYGKARGGSC